MVKESIAQRELSIMYELTQQGISHKIIVNINKFVERFLLK